MKHLRILIIALLFPLALHAQSADQRIGKLLGSGDWFSLNREYYQVKDSVQTDVTFNVAGKDAIVPDVLIYTSPDGNSTSGTVGLALLRHFRKVTLDLKNMMLTVR